MKLLQLFRKSQHLEIRAYTCYNHIIRWCYDSRWDYKTIKHNQDLINYILKDKENFYKIQNKIINKNFIENVSIDWTPSGPCDVDMYLLKLSIELKSQDIEIISSQGNYAFLKSIKDKLYTNQKSSLKFNDIISLIFLIIFIILFIYLTMKLFIS